MEKKGFQIGSVGFIVGPILFLLTLAAPMGDLGLAAKTVLGLSLWMGAWWISEAIPIYVTGLLPVAIGASYGFILPAATPPNAIAVAWGLVSPKKMAKFGLPLNLISVLIVAIMTFLLVPVLW